MYSPFHSHQGSSSSPTMEPLNEVVEQELPMEENADEMSEEEIDLEMIEDHAKEGEETRQKDADEGAKPFEKRQRKKKSQIWDDMKEVKQADGTFKIQCNHCKELFAKSASGATSQHKRHLKNCLQKKLAGGEENRKKQQVLSFTEGPSDEGRYVCDANANLDVLAWWKGERWRFPILSRMACDVLGIPVTTVASESTFSAGGRIIDDRRASMLVETVQMLFCGNDWIRNFHGLKNKSREPWDVAKASTIEEIDLLDV